MMKKQTLESFLDEGRSFTELLPYFSHENGFFVLKDGSLGQVWEVSLIESETKVQRLFRTVSSDDRGYPYPAS